MRWRIRGIVQAQHLLDTFPFVIYIMWLGEHYQTPCDKWQRWEHIDAWWCQTWHTRNC